jgi:hypothetical protein
MASVYSAIVQIAEVFSLVCKDKFQARKPTCHPGKLLPHVLASDLFKCKIFELN